MARGSGRVVNGNSTTVGATLESNALARLPVGRRFSDALYLAPGVSSSGTAGTANPSVSGSSGLENQYIVDGINITNQGYGALGSYSIVFGSLGNGTPFDFMQEVQVKTAGYEAEFGQATGGVINVVTKSGTNQIAGTVFGYTRPTRACVVQRATRHGAQPGAAGRRLQRVQHPDGARLRQLDGADVWRAQPRLRQGCVSSVVAGQQIQAPRQVRIGVRFEF